MQINRFEPVTSITPGLLGAAGPLGRDLAVAHHAVAPAERTSWGAGVASPALPPAPLMVATAAVAAAVPRAATSAPDASTLARLADDVYLAKSSPPAGFRVATNAELARIGVDPALLATRSNGYRARAYVTGSGDTTRVVIAFKGSATRGDWEANVRQAVGSNTDHYNRALQIGQRIARQGVTNVTFTGHSLGGGLASAAGLAAGRSTVTFNAAGLSDATIRQATAIRSGAGRAAPDIRAYFVRGEVLSALQDGGDRRLGEMIGRSVLGPLGGHLGGRVDAPSAYGTRVELDAVRPAGTGFWGDNAVARHGMEWVHAGLRGR